jgi:hypothetical protein
VATLGERPHLAAGLPLPLTDASLADRGPRRTCDRWARGFRSTRCSARLDAALDGLPGAFARRCLRPPARRHDECGSWLPGARFSGRAADLVTALAQSLAARAAALTVTDRAAPTHLGVGAARVLLPIVGNAGEPTIDAWVRIDAGRIRLGATDERAATPATGGGAACPMHSGQAAGWSAMRPARRPAHPRRRA